jgi:hypothetical protein
MRRGIIGRGTIVHEPVPESPPAAPCWSACPSFCGTLLLGGGLCRAGVPLHTQQRDVSRTASGSSTRGKLRRWRSHETTRARLMTVIVNSRVGRGSRRRSGFTWQSQAAEFRRGVDWRTRSGAFAWNILGIRIDPRYAHRHRSRWEPSGRGIVGDRGAAGTRPASTIWDRAGGLRAGGRTVCRRKNGGDQHPDARQVEALVRRFVRLPPSAGELQGLGGHFTGGSLRNSAVVCRNSRVPLRVTAATLNARPSPAGDAVERPDFTAS